MPINLPKTRSTTRTALFSLLGLLLASLLVACAEQPEDTATEAPDDAEVTAEVVEVEDVDASWSYAGDTGPDAWGSLSDDWAGCSSGASQSPIDLTGATSAELEPLRFDYEPFRAAAVFDGHAVKVTAPGGTLAIGDDTYTLQQMHFHAGSEHTVDGRQFPLELHLVHMNDAEELAVVGLLIEEGEESEGFIDLWTALPTEANEGATGADAEIDVANLLPAARTSWRYDGSLTTPPCSEGVRWIVMTEPVTLSAEQIAQAAAILADSYRPVQPLGSRTVRTDAG